MHTVVVVDFHVVGITVRPALLKFGCRGVGGRSRDG